jgi:hypothetical protein
MFFDPAIIATLKLKEAMPKPLEDGHADGDLNPFQEKQVTKRTLHPKRLMFQRLRINRKMHG